MSVYRRDMAIGISLSVSVMSLPTARMTTSPYAAAPSRQDSQADLMKQRALGSPQGQGRGATPEYLSHSR